MHANVFITFRSPEPPPHARAPSSASTRNFGSARLVTRSPIVLLPTFAEIPATICHATSIDVVLFSHNCAWTLPHGTRRHDGRRTLYLFSEFLSPICDEFEREWLVGWTRAKIAGARERSAELLVEPTLRALSSSMPDWTIVFDHHRADNFDDNVPSGSFLRTIAKGRSCLPHHETTIKITYLSPICVVSCNLRTSDAS
jgi:hypothetical protein